MNDPTQPYNLRRGSWLMALSVVCFAVNALLLKYFASERGIGAPVSMAFRFAVGLMVTTGFFSPLIRRAFKSRLLCSRGLLGGLSTAAFYYTVGPLGAGKAVLIGNTWTLWAALLAVWTLREKLSAGRLASIAAAIVGLSMLLGVGLKGFGQDWQWELVALGGALGAAGVVVIIRELTRTETSATIFASQCVYGLLMSAPFAVGHVAHLGGGDVLWLIAAGLMATAGQVAMTEGFRFLPVAVGGGFQITLPLIISIGGVLLFDEHFTTWQVVGGMLILAGSFLTIGRRS
jgi:drug/metabolite transporter (DMT)-like permease